MSAYIIQPKIMPDINEMNFVLRKKTENIVVPLKQAEKLWSNVEFRKDLPLVLLITGWSTNFDDYKANDALDTMFAAYMCRGNVNFVVNIKYISTSIECALIRE